MTEHDKVFRDGVWVCSCGGWLCSPRAREEPDRFEERAAKAFESHERAIRVMRDAGCDV